MRRLDPALEVETVQIRTLGDVMPEDRRGKVDGKSAFTGELEAGLLDGRIDAAVHSLKDLPSDIPADLVVAATPKRGDPRDALVSAKGGSLSDAKRAARIGTSSVRRRSQLLRMRPDLNIVEMHGNVETRLRKIESSGLDGVVLAAAGLQRLGLEGRISQYFEPEQIVPAVCQGTLAVEARRDEPEVLRFLGGLEDRTTRACSEAEREFARKLGGDCYVPLGAFASASGARISAVGIVTSLDGRETATARAEGEIGRGREIGAELADKVMHTGGREILEELHN
jgi:hydroxymethylbilane synthase